MARSWIRTTLVIAAFLGAIGHVGCGKDPDGIVKPPEMTPETELTYAPLEGDTASFRIHFFWNGYDDDGEITRFRYAVDADTLRPFSEWTATEAKDTTLLFLVDPVTEIRGHVFWIVAEDNEGNFDPTPAKRFFSAKTIPPFSRITRGPSGRGTIIGPSFTFEWEGTDPDGGETGGPAPVDSFEYIMLQVNGQAEVGHPKLPPYSGTDPKFTYLNLIAQATGPSLNPPYDDWKWIGIRGTRKRFRNVTPDFYFFAVRAVDIAGATEKWPNPRAADIRNIRDFNVTNRNPGPLLEVCSSVLVQCLSPTSGPTDIVRREIQIFEGETISFSWTANADTYGGEIIGYTYALDDTSTTEWSSIDLRKTGVTFQPSQLPVGSHFLFVRVMDDGGLVTNMKIPIKIVHPRFRDDTGGRPRVLYVDDFAPPPGDWETAKRGSPNFPVDREREDDPTNVEDQWWFRTITNPLSQEFGVEFTVADPVFEGTFDIQGRKVYTPEFLSDFRVIIWSTDFNNTLSSPTALWRTLVGGSYSELAGYLRAGGTLVVTGFQLANQTSGRSDVPYSNFSRGMCGTLDEGSLNWKLSYFPRNFMGIDAALANDTALRSSGARDFVEAQVTPEGAALGFVSGAVDVGDPSTGAKWNPNAFSGGTLDARLAPGLPKIDGWRLATDFGCFPANVAGLVRRENSGPISIPILKYHGVHQGVLEDGAPSPREGLVVGIATQAHDLGNGGGGFITGPGNASGAIGRMVFLGFPLYYIKDAEAYAIMRAAFAYVNASPTLPSYTP